MTSSGPYAVPWNHFLTGEVSPTISQARSGKGLLAEGMGPLESTVLPGGAFSLRKDSYEYVIMNSFASTVSFSLSIVYLGAFSLWTWLCSSRWIKGLSDNGYSLRQGWRTSGPLAI